MNVYKLKGTNYDKVRRVNYNQYMHFQHFYYFFIWKNDVFRTLKVTFTL